MATVKRKPVPSSYALSNQDRPAYLGQPENDQRNNSSDNTAFDSSEKLLNDRAIGGTSPSPQQYIKWGIAWESPTFMICFALVGISIALGHHFYFSSLDGTVAGSETRQQWALRFGTAFSFLVVACLKTANDQAYQQYIWTIVRRKSLSLGTLDKLFGLLSNPFSFFSLDLIWQARFAVLLGFICW